MVNRLEKYEIAGLVRSAIKEDIGGYGDITSKYLLPEKSISSGYIICKQPGGGVLSGMDVAMYIFKEIDPEIRIAPLKQDGEILDDREKICDIEGPAVSILKAERTALNFIQHMSGIATLTSKFVKIAEPFGVKIADTRKTRPLLRKIEKYAVRCGGGHNHRFGLFDGILIKDNHIAAAGGVLNAVKAIRKDVPHTLRIEVEVKDFDELDQALEGKADIIMLDNMDPRTMKKAVSIIRKADKEIIVEASGNVDLDTLPDICRSGIDIVSVGAITHSAPALDFSLELED
jgi:nicotinate-nucleotide pyrophosphorylase (carboxylating)